MWGSWLLLPTFFFFSFKRKENCEKENSICHDLGFYSSESSYTSRIRIPLMEYFLLFSKKHCRAQKDLFFFINYQHLQQRERQLLEGISDNAAAKSLQSCPTLCDLITVAHATETSPGAVHRALSQTLFRGKTEGKLPEKSLKIPSTMCFIILRSASDHIKFMGHMKEKGPTVLA